MIQKKQKYNPEWWNNVTRLTSTSTQHKVISGILSSLEVDKLYSVADIIRLIFKLITSKQKHWQMCHNHLYNTKVVQT